MTMRFDLVMSLKETEAKYNLKESIDPSSFDPFFSFINCVDECIHENKPDSGHLETLKNIVLSIPEDFSVVGPLAAVASNPLFQSFLCKVILHRLNVVVDKQMLPKVFFYFYALLY